MYDLGGTREGRRSRRLSIFFFLQLSVPCIRCILMRMRQAFCCTIAGWKVSSLLCICL